jgi:hypothetical protein
MLAIGDAREALFAVWMLSANVRIVRTPLRST